MANQVIIFPRGQLTELDRARMEEVGIVAVEADDPKSVVTVVPGVPLATSDDVAMAALGAVANSGISSMGMDFARALHDRMKDREAGHA